MNDNSKSQIALLEEKVLKFWQDNSIFEKSLKQPSPKGEYVFYDGPPFATGLPHYGHLLPGTIKDIIPRYRTMQGYKVERKWGWDCHGLPIENLIQKEHDLKTRTDIESFGIKKFNQEAKNSVFKYNDEWKKIIPRTGRFIDMDDQYTTMDPKFMESVIWGFSELYKKGLAYEDFKIMHISPPLETSLSNFEVNQGYRDITDISAYVKFELKNEPDTFVLAWTTTPWTLPGNVALAVGSEIDYVKVRRISTSTINAEKDYGKYESPANGEVFIVAKDRFKDVFEKQENRYEIFSEIKGAKLVGREYLPIFDYYSKQNDLDNKENGWKIYAGDFVTTEDGTGIVHIAPAFGQDDLNLGKRENLPFVQHVNIDGTIKKEVTDFAGLQAKPKHDPMETDIEVIKKLAHSGKLFAKEKINHSYPHCWRTDAPLLNYAMSSWFIKVTDFNKKMVSLNNDINWVPKSIGSKRFGNWLEGAKDWGISRSRYWGTPIPIWKSEDGKEIEVLGSLDEIKEKTRSKNKFFLMRHGEAEHNISKFLSSDNSVPSNLTEKGVEQIKENAGKLKDKNITTIYCSPLNRAIKTASILAKEINFPEDKIIIDDRIREVGGGIMNGKPSEKYHQQFSSPIEQFSKAPEEGETLSDIRKRVGEFIYEIDKKHDEENILIVTHEYPIWMLTALKDGLDNKKSAELKTEGKDFVAPGYFAEYDFIPLPHDDDYVLDFHRPYIDEIVFEKNGKAMKRIPDIFDGWFDSGSMPHAVPHYPFNKDKFDLGGFFKKSKGFPADFIAESLDQTRGWFYTLLAINTALFNKTPYKNVIVSGLILAEDGQKMSKRLKNYPDVNYILDKYGADAMRYYLMSSPAVKSESLNFSEKGVDEVLKKINTRLLNVLSFYELYKEEASDYKTSDKDGKKVWLPKLKNVLDQWIVYRLSEVLEETTKSIESYEIDRATRPLFDFVDDLSTWYLRRSRDRFKGDNQDDKDRALNTTAYVLLEAAKIMAPFMPFLAEDIFQRVTESNYKKPNSSIHLEKWPAKIAYDEKNIEAMQKVREIVSVGLETRDSLGIKVRQPLQTLKIKDASYKLTEEFLSLIKDEVNVKEVIYDESIGEKIWLDNHISKELKEEGMARDLIRLIQSLRKEKSLTPDQEVVLLVETNEKGEKLVQKFEKEIFKTAKLKKIDFQNLDGEEIKIADLSFRIKIK